ncbi:MAG TPA: S-adenosyl-L-homocysteine hydrolase [Croceibacterium sp.]|nr:S-adenosyl-L-homocysteine hydrolase [Croceibacterium sp.]
MGYATKGAAAIAAGLLLAGSPAAAQSDLAAAEKLRRLDIMLMVTALRCRFGADDFQADYNAFAARHLETMNAAGRRLTQALAAQHGAQGARRALDRLSTRMANAYGMGHPTLGCAELKQATHELSLAQDASLAAAADTLLAGGPGDSVFLLAQR